MTLENIDNIDSYRQNLWRGKQYPRVEKFDNTTICVKALMLHIPLTYSWPYQFRIISFFVINYVFFLVVLHILPRFIHIIKKTLNYIASSNAHLLKTLVWDNWPIVTGYLYKKTCTFIWRMLLCNATVTHKWHLINLTMPMQPKCKARIKMYLSVVPCKFAKRNNYNSIE